MPRPSAPTTAFAALLAVAATALVGLHATDAGLDVLLRRMHLRPASTAEWVATQPLPGMYNFANRARVSPLDMPWDEVWPEGEPGAYVNHYPPRVATFVQARAGFRALPCPAFVYAESAVRGRTLRTRWRVAPHGDGLRLDRAGFDPSCRG